jgi:perosamine synthetase
MERNIHLFKVHMPESVLKPVNEVILSGYVGQGPKVEEFEKKIGEFVGNKNALTVNSGTSAIQLAYRLAGVGIGDEVISTPMTNVATNVTIVAAGGKIKWADINPETGCISADSIKERISDKTKAIMAMQWGGYPADMDEIHEIAQEYGIKVIEDAAQGFGSTYKGRMTGSYSDFTIFSFQAVKHISTFDGGALMCREREDYDRGKLLRWFGVDREEKGRRDFRCEKDIKEWGYKSHMNDVCATVGIEQMNYIEEILRKTRDNAKRFDEELEGVEKLKYSDDRKSAYWLYTIRVKDLDSFFPKMREKGIMVSQVHARNDTHTMFKEFYEDLPGVNKFVDGMVCIPVGWWLSNDDVDYIIKTIKELA